MIDFFTLLPMSAMTRGKYFQTAEAGRCQRQYGERCLVAGGAKNGVFAEVSRESGSILHVDDSPFLLPMSDGAPNSECSRSQGQMLLFRGDRQGDSRSAGWRAAETRRVD